MEHKKKIIGFSITGFLLAALGFIALLLAGSLITAIIHQKMALRPESPSYPMWRDMDIPIYQKFYLFNITNPSEVEQGADPIVKEIGPFVYRLNISKSELNFLDNETELTFRETKRFYFVPQMSPYDLSTTITTLNVPLASAYGFLPKLNSIIRSIIEAILSRLKPRFFFTATAEELLFKGKKNIFACIAHAIDPKLQPSCYFSYFGDQNNTNDGLFKINTGVNNISGVNSIITLNGADKVDFWQTDECNKISGATNGELFAPLDTMSGRQLKFFRTDFCRVFNLTLNETGVSSDYNYLKVDRFIPAIDSFWNATQNPHNKCYRQKPVGDSMHNVSSSTIVEILDKYKFDVDWLKPLVSMLPTTFSQKQTPAMNFEEMPSGVFDLSPCHNGVPIFISYPHFYTADSYYLRHVKGLHPNESIHKSYIDVEPQTGSPIDFLARIQININVATDKSAYPQMRSMLYPTLWQEFSIHVTKEIADTILNQTETPTIAAFSISSLILTIGIILFLYALTLIYLHYNHHKQETGQTILTDTDPLIGNNGDNNNNNIIS